MFTRAERGALQVHYGAGIGLGIRDLSTPTSHPRTSDALGGGAGGAMDPGLPGGLLPAGVEGPTASNAPDLRTAPMDLLESHDAHLTLWPAHVTCPTCGKHAPPPRQQRAQRQGAHRLAGGAAAPPAFRQLFDTPLVMRAA